jgi:hypothetical protein
MIALAAARDHGERVSGAIVMNTVIPVPIRCALDRALRR